MRWRTPRWESLRAHSRFDQLGVIESRAKRPFFRQYNLSPIGNSAAQSSISVAQSKPSDVQTKPILSDALKRWLRFE
jgi:hypothetical protein